MCLGHVCYHSCKICEYVSTSVIMFTCVHGQLCTLSTFAPYGAAPEWAEFPCTCNFFSQVEVHSMVPCACSLGCSSRKIAFTRQLGTGRSSVRQAKPERGSSRPTALLTSCARHLNSMHRSAHGLTSASSNCSDSAGRAQAAMMSHIFCRLSIGDQEA